MMRGYVSQPDARVTWLLPVRNAMPFLPATLESIALQTRRDFEVLAWDNGSTDGSAEVLRQWIGSRLPGRAVLNRPMGLGASLAAMVSLARTPLCARIDGDDINEPHRLERQIALLDARPRVAVVGSAMRLIDPSGELLPETRLVAVDDAELRWRLRFHNPLCHPTVVFRREAALEAGNYRDLMPVEDIDLWLRLAQRHELANIAEPLVRYRVHAASVSAAHRPDIDARRRVLMHGYVESILPGLTAEQYDRLVALVRDESCREIDFSDVRLLRRAAVVAARAIGRPASYFTHTDLYHVQARSLLRRWLCAQPVIGSVYQVLKRSAA